MKNNYIVKFVLVDGRILYICNIMPPCVGLNSSHAYIFTNKKTAKEKAFYFSDYILSDPCTYEIIKL